MTISDAEAAGAAPTPPAAPDDVARRARTRVRALAVLAVVFFAGALGLAIVAASLKSTLDAERGDRRAVEQTASCFAAHLLTFDYRKMDEHRDAIFALSTGKFRKEYTEAFASLKELITAGQTVSTGTVQELFTGSIADGNASAIAVVSADSKGKAGTRTGVTSYVELALVKVGSSWRVDGVTNLNFGAAGIESPATSSTTVPAPATTAPPAG